MDDVYRDRQDPAVTVGLKLKSTVPELQGVEALVWTTTPWTLPSNLAAAVHPDVSYVVVQAANGRKYLLAEARVGAYARELGESPAVLAKFIGKQLVGTRYTPPFDFFAGRQANAHQILSADYVTTEDGTGMVHIAPAYGEEDKAVTDAAGIEPSRPSTRAASSTRRCRPTKACTSSRRTRRSSKISEHRARCCATTRTSTRIRTAGAATIHSSSAR
jgi:isoleucyl-tRNA synthetase